MIASTCQSSLLAIVSEGGASKPPERDEELNEKITFFACEVLRVYHGLDEFKHLYKGLEISGFIENRHGNDPCCEKMQKGFNSLKDRAKAINHPFSPISQTWACLYKR